MEHSKLGRSVQIECQLEFASNVLSREGTAALIQRMERGGGRITMDASNADVKIQVREREDWVGLKGGDES